jgi:hypothetical protein
MVPLRREAVVERAETLAFVGLEPPRASPLGAPTITIDASSVAGAQATVRFMFDSFLMSQGAFSRLSASC